MRELSERPEATVDVTREVCPMTYVRTKLALERLADGQLLEVLLRGEEPRRNVPRSAQEDGHEVVSKVEAGEVVRILIRKKTKKRS
ncbi:MAG: sulfurtransferase TusA family protein [Myxococcales bacterium]|nr:sulfurtransferase TusA family protein [Myxococcales bacterium]